MKLFIVLFFVFSFISCGTCDKCPPRYQTKFIAPKILCPTPDEVIIKEITSDDTYIGELVEINGKQAIYLEDYNKSYKKVSDKIGENLKSYRENDKYWRYVYQVCIKNSLEAIEKIIQETEKKGDSK